MELTNTQMVMVTELEILIKRMKEEGAEFQAIKEACIEKGRGNWLVTDKKQQDDAIGAALYAFAMDDKQREATELLSKLIYEGSELNEGEVEEQ